jgi:L-threonylcarbamoyladenylate synthase
MVTRVTRSPRIAAAILRSGGVVAFPTETVYGLGADAFNAKAVEKIFRAKGRPTDNPLIVHIAELSQLEKVALRVTSSAQRAVERFFPGPLTVILPRHPTLPLSVTAGLDTVGVRFPVHPVAQAFLEECGVPVAAPSANRSGRPSPTTWRAAEEELDGRVDCILQGGSSTIGLESTVIDCTHASPRILREGAISLEQLREVWPQIKGISTRQQVDEPARSPGMKYRHYAPSARVFMISSAKELRPELARSSAFIGLSNMDFPTKPRRTCLCRDVEDYAQRLFHFFRACEKAGITHIYCQRVPKTGIGRALMDRVQRAAEL